ncbi:uncharacterized protein DUF2017 [Sediminihabitans luteus]|uniref:Uncharacterized protein DUF2017 n=1 Tax=Sediminihabitans luteus TaxID=1138585 RepID=A0A2M9CYH6_9CELL|nr:DUF2017 family protein [Sediminihabitans luteus]PJJ76903.1 uncharacterized protein DUF2017 [Sediminihabitans luteus]GII99544.1 hypothetical protein Slu03_19220 [Sediminihabitans luteus]
MRRFVRGADDAGAPAYVAELDATERIVLAQVVGDVAQMLESALPDPQDVVDDAGTPVEEGAGVPLEDLPPHGTSPDAVRPPDDPALARLLPDASRDDPEVSAEFRRLTQADVAERKSAGLVRLAHLLLADEPAVGEPSPLAVAPGEARAVAAALTDVRLVLASRLGVETDEQAEALHAEAAQGSDAGARGFLVGVFLALGWLQETLLELMLADLRR